MSLNVVQLNVGGTKYQVSRSLIETYPHTMLARLISEEWQNDPDKEIFIDRDGCRFRYVLDYMRDQKANLTMAVSKASVLMELEYFGFTNIEEDAINVEILAVDAAENLHSVKKSLLFSRIACEALERIAANGCFSVSLSQDMTNEISRLFPESFATESVKDSFHDQFNGKLAEYGLRAVDIRVQAQLPRLIKFMKL